MSVLHTHTAMTKEALTHIVQDIMIAYGPDGHTDGSDVIADFIVALQEGRHEVWLAENLKNDKL